MKKTILNILIIVFVIIIAVSGVMVFRILSAQKKSTQITQTLFEAAVSVNDAQNTDDVGEYDEVAPFQVDFPALEAENDDITAWLYSADTPINNPVAQAEDNEYYLHHLLDGSTNTAGTLFLDNRNSADFSDPVTIIYGHNMKNDTMFGTLTEYENQEYYDAHPSVYLMTPDGNYRVDLVAGYTTSSTAETYMIDDYYDDHDAYMQAILGTSTFAPKFSLEDGDQILILSTCAYVFDEARYVVVGKMTPIG